MVSAKTSHPLMKPLKLSSYCKNKAALHMLIQMSLKGFWELRAQIEYMGKQKIHSIQSILQEDLPEEKDLKLLQELQLLRYAPTLQDLSEFQLLFVEFMDSSQQEARDFQ